MHKNQTIFSTSYKIPGVYLTIYPKKPRINRRQNFVSLPLKYKRMRTYIRTTIQKEYPPTNKLSFLPRTILLPEILLT